MSVVLEVESEELGVESEELEVGSEALGAVSAVLEVSEAAEALFTSQPGVSKQIRLLEDELGVQIFIRSGKRIVAVTQVGMAILETAEQVLRGVRNIKNIGGEFAKTESGSFTVGATHDLLRFRLPSVLAGFRDLFPDVRLVLKQGSPAELMGMVFNGEVDLALTMDAAGDWGDLRGLPFGEWRYVLVLPRGHELAERGAISLADLASLPLLTYGFAFEAGALAARAFARARLSWHTVFESDDGAVLLDYVRLGLGAGLIDGLRRECFKFFVLQRAVVQRRGQAEAVFHQCFFARAIAPVHPV